MDILASSLFFRFTKHAGTLSRDDLDVYDSELVKDLIGLHDEIQNHPIRAYDYNNPHEIERYYHFTFRALQERLLPAVERALKVLKGRPKEEVEEYLDDAEEHLKASDVASMVTGHGPGKAIALVEEAFVNLHDAIEVVRAATRKVPKVHHVKKPQAAFDSDFGGLNTVGAE